MNRPLPDRGTSRPATAQAPDTIAAEKSGLRAIVRQRLAALAPSHRESQSQRIQSRLAASPDWQRAQLILGFASLPDEPSLLPFLLDQAKAGQPIALPRWDPTLNEYRPARLVPGAELTPGPFKVWEPPADAPAASFEQLDLVLVPGLAFDRSGRRLGRGKGYFDRLLARTPCARRWGVAFDVQIVDRVPAAPHDLNVHLLVTAGLWWPVIPAD
ncbi:MAG: 5-formyltetrahydrofolate cyclo-ligase [Verrucomicrobiae bacterium]|nr:5-formyltetrahydrofolate cyclo-ligase [Verrucomicrobiae bacterium]